MSETLPPLTKADIRVHLENPTFSVYIYVGAADDLAWQIAEATEGFLTRLRVYRAANRAAVSDWLPTEDTVAVVFGWGKAPFAHLDQEEAENMLLVSQTIADARS